MNQNQKMITDNESNKLEIFINDYLREDLKQYEKHLNMLNSDIEEYTQLEHMIKSINTHLLNDATETNNSFKTQTNIGGNIFMRTKINNTNNILINVGLNHYVEFTFDEALKFIKFKTNILNKQADVIRDESIKTKANIKLALLCLGDTDKKYL